MGSGGWVIGAAEGAALCPFTVVTLQYTCLTECQVTRLHFISYVILYNTLQMHTCVHLKCWLDST